MLKLAVDFGFLGFVGVIDAGEKVSVVRLKTDQSVVKVGRLSDVFERKAHVVYGDFIEDLRDVDLFDLRLLINL